MKIERAFEDDTRNLTHFFEEFAYDELIELMDAKKYKQRERLSLKYYLSLDHDDPVKVWMDNVFLTTPQEPCDSKSQHVIFFYDDKILAIVCTTCNSTKTIHITEDTWFGLKIHKRPKDDLIRKFFNQKLLEHIVSYLAGIEQKIRCQQMFQLEDTAFVEASEPGIEEIDGTFRCKSCGAEEDFTEEHGVLFCACGAKKTLD